MSVGAGGLDDQTRQSLQQGDCGRGCLVLEQMSGRCIRAELQGLMGIGRDRAGEYDNFPKGTE